MFKSLKYLFIAAFALTLFCEVVPLAIAVATHDKPLLDEIARSHLRIFEYGAKTIFRHPEGHHLRSGPGA
jgi:hypothetical protein